MSDILRAMKLADVRREAYKALVTRFTAAGGEVSFLRYAWLGSQMSSNPNVKLAFALHRNRRAMTPLRLPGARTKAKALAAALANLGPGIRRYEAVDSMLRLLPVLRRVLEGAERTYQHTPSAGNWVRYPRRYFFFGALMPYLRFRGIWTEEGREGWLGDWTGLDDKTQLLDPTYDAARYADRTLDVRRIDVGRFILRPGGDTINWRAWWLKARRVANPLARSLIIQGANAYLEWRRWKAGALANRTWDDRMEQYTQEAWGMLLNECQLDDPENLSGLLHDRLSAAAGLSSVQQVLDVDIPSSVGIPDRRCLLCRLTGK